MTVYQGMDEYTHWCWRRGEIIRGWVRVPTMLPFPVGAEIETRAGSAYVTHREAGTYTALVWMDREPPPQDRPPGGDAVTDTAPWWHHALTDDGAILYRTVARLWTEYLEQHPDAPYADFLAVITSDELRHAAEAMADAIRQEETPG